MKPKEHLTREQQRVYRRVKMEMKSLDHRLKKLPKTHPNKEERKAEESFLQNRMDKLEQKLRNHNII